MSCPTKRQGTWQTLPLILLLCRWLLPSFSSCIWFLLFLGSVHQESFNSLKRVGRRWQQTEAGPVLQTIPDGYSAAQTWKPFLSLCWLWTLTMLQLQEEVCSSFKQPRYFWTKWLPKAMVVPIPCLLHPIKAVFIYAGVFWKVLHKHQRKTL